MKKICENCKFFEGREFLNKDRVWCFPKIAKRGQRWKVWKGFERWETYFGQTRDLVKNPNCPYYQLNWLYKIWVRIIK